MAKTIDTTKLKQAQRKKVLVVLGIVLLAALALQGPKLVKQVGGSSSTPAAEGAGSDASTPAAGTTITPGTLTTGTATTAGSTGVTTPVPAGVPRAVLVGVTVGADGQPKPGEGQLRVFTLFTAKDPFVQQLPQDPVSAAASPTVDANPAKGGADDGSSTTASADEPPSFATIAINGEPEALEVKQLFPEREQLFVLVALKGKTARIAVSGGAFTDGRTITLKLGKNLTLVNTATGARYSLRLLYVGEEPEQVESFTSKAATEPKK